MGEPRSVTVPLFHQFCGWNVRGLIPRKICLTKDIDTNCAEFSRDVDVWHRRLGVRVRLKQYLRTADRDAGRGKRRVVNLPDCSIARCLCAIASRGARLVCRTLGALGAFPSRGAHAVDVSIRHLRRVSAIVLRVGPVSHPPIAVEK